VAAQLGYCGLDRERRPLRGDEIRACWEASTVPIEVAPAGAERHVPPVFHPVHDETPVRKLEFVEVGAAPAKAPRRKTSRPAADVQPDAFTPAEPPSSPVAAGEPRWSLWGDAEI